MKISARTANALRNVERNQWLPDYTINYTGIVVMYSINSYPTTQSITQVLSITYNINSYLITHLIVGIVCQLLYQLLNQNTMTQVLSVNQIINSYPITHSITQA